MSVVGTISKGQQDTRFRIFTEFLQHRGEYDAVPPLGTLLLLVASPLWFCH